MTDRPPTIGEALASIDVPTGLTLAALALVVIGSIGPWATAPLNSAGGLQGDGKWTILGAAIIAALTFTRNFTPAGLLCLVIVAIGVSDAIHIHRVVARVTFEGHQLDHVGWGVYAVIVGAGAAVLPLYRARFG